MLGRFFWMLSDADHCLLSLDVGHAYVVEIGERAAYTTRSPHLVPCDKYLFLMISPNLLGFSQVVFATWLPELRLQVRVFPGF